MNPVLIWLLLLLIVVITTFVLTDKGRALCHLLRRYLRLHKKILLLFFLLLLLIGIFSVLSGKIYPQKATDDRTAKLDSLGLAFGSTQAEILAEKRHIPKDSDISLSTLRPELSYVIPSILKTFKTVTKAKKLPVIIRVHPDSFIIWRTSGLKTFKNLGIRFQREMHKRLGKNYEISVTSHGYYRNYFTVRYTGKAWTGEQIYSLMILWAAHREKINPALLMAWVKMISNFDVGFRDEKGNQGLLALNQTVPQTELLLGAKKLKEVLDNSPDTETALSKLYPGKRISRQDHQIWWKHPLILAWVEEFLDNTQYYEDLHLFSEKKP